MRRKNFSIHSVTLLLQKLHINRRGAFLPLLDIEAHPLTLIESLKSAILDSAVMNKHISAFTGFDESKALAFIKPLYFAFRHLSVLLSKNFQKAGLNKGRKKKPPKLLRAWRFTSALQNFCRLLLCPTNH